MQNRCVLALGGGVARGLAHIGVIRGMQDDGVEIAGVAGTSMGALIGGLCAEGLDAAEMERLFAGVDWPTVGRVLVRSVIGEAFADLLREILGSARIETLGIPFAAVACDLDRAEEVVLRDGPVWRAVLASAAIPGIFDAVERDGRTLVDGAIVSPVPVTVASGLADAPVVAVNVLRPPDPGAESMPGRGPADRGEASPLVWLERWARRFASVGRDTDESRPGRWGALLRSMHILQYRLAGLACRDVVTIEPDVGAFGWLDFPRVRELVTAGERAWHRHREQERELEQQRR